MAAHTSDSAGGIDALSRLLVAYRLPIYLGGLAAIGAPLAVASAFDVAVPASARTAIVVASLSVMVATYVAERRVGVADPSDDRTGGDEREAYPFAMRVAVALAVLGVALGVYVGLERNLLTGLLFVGGAYLFAYLGYRVLDRGTEGSR